MTTQAERLLQTEEADAWFEYAGSCEQARLVGYGSIRYDEVEPWAWNRLQARLNAVAARRRALARPARIGAAA